MVPPVNISKPVLLNAMLIIPVPGDPSSIEYDEHIPDLYTPLVFGISTVAVAHDSTPISNTPVYFPTTVTLFVTIVRWAAWLRSYRLFLTHFTISSVVSSPSSILDITCHVTQG
jgi:hypothetical protein